MALQVDSSRLLSVGLGLVGLMLIGFSGWALLSKPSAPMSHSTVHWLAFNPSLPETVLEQTEPALGGGWQPPRSIKDNMGPSFRGGSRSATTGLSMSAKSVQLGPIPDKLAWVNFIEADEVPPGAIVGRMVGGQDIAVANDGGTLYAIADNLPPTSSPASSGILLGNGIIQDPLSKSQFDMKTGQNLAWCPGGLGFIYKLLQSPTDVAAFKVRKQGKFIQVELNVNAKAQFEKSYWKGILDARGKADGGYY